MSSLKTSLPRYEIKFIINPIEYHRVHNWLHRHTSCLKTEYPDRQVNNVYFDSYTYQSYCQNIFGLSEKSKVRLRWYGVAKEPQNGSLEIKSKRNHLNWKLIYKIENNIALKGSDWRAFRLGIREQLPAEGRRWIEMNPLPVLINRYKRKYFVSKYKDIRVTLDSNLDIYDQSHKPFPNYSSKSNLPKVLVLEIKFQREQKSYFLQTFRDIPWRSSRYSKYIAGLLSINGNSWA
jgi:hypothetical protein